jgi:hypothetical protein
MADISGTSGNDVIQASSGGTLTFLASGTTLNGGGPIINVLVNGSPVLAGFPVTASHAAGQTQLVTVAIPAGTIVSSIGIEFTNDDHTPTYTEDRDLYLSSVQLNGIELPISAANYLAYASPYNIPATTDMKWGGTLTYSGAAVESAGAAATGSLHIDGGAGIDTVVFGGTEASYGISHPSSGYLVWSTELVKVERLQFAETKLALDMNGHAGTAVELIAALFGPSAVGVKGFVGAVLGLLDGGMGEEQLANLAIHTPLFQQMAGSSSNTDFVRLVVHNLLGADPSQQLLNTLVGVLDNGTLTQASFAVIAADSSFNAVHLVGVMQNGVEFV